VHIKASKVEEAVNRIVGGEGIVLTNYYETKQDPHLADNQKDGFRCGDNGIFKGVPVTQEENNLSLLARTIYKALPYDGKYIIDGKRIIICQSHTEEPFVVNGYEVITNPLGPWTGGPDVDTGATNRKLGSDMGDAVTGGGLHGKDLSKADVSVNIVCHLLAQERRCPVSAMCSIGDDVVRFKVNGEYEDHFYDAVVAKAREYIFEKCGGFEKFAEWGLLRP
jgi:S-adenosylmethionine synthetase